MHSFLNNNNNNIYNLQFGFRQIYCTSEALINITENIRKTLDDGNVGRFRTLCNHAKNFWYCRPPDAVCKIESLWDLWNFKWLIEILSVYLKSDVSITYGHPFGILKIGFLESKIKKYITHCWKYCKIKNDTCSDEI